MCCLVFVHGVTLVTYHAVLNNDTSKNAAPGARSVAQAKSGQR